MLRVSLALCVQWKKHVKPLHRYERWWHERQPGKLVYNSVHAHKLGWLYPKQEYPINMHRKRVLRNQIEHAFNKRGYSIYTPKYGG